jgi:Fe-S cluster assembly ATPase SufC
MIDKITVKPDTLPYQILFFHELDLRQFGQVVPLFGPNGAGKSTLIQGIIDAGMKNNDDIKITITHGIKTSFYAYRNSTDNLKVCRPKSYAMVYNIGFCALQWDARSLSEGQSVIFSIMDLLDSLDTNAFVDGEHTTIVLDEIDSGLSIDNIDMVMRKIRRIVKRRNDVQIIFSFNQPRVLKWFPDVLSMYDGSKITMHNEDDMMAVINEHKKEFDRIRKRKGRPKVFK